MSKDAKTIFERLEKIAENTMAVYNAGLIEEKARQEKEELRQEKERERQACEQDRREQESIRIEKENARIENENTRIENDIVRDKKITEIETLVGQIDAVANAILAEQEKYIGGDT